MIQFERFELANGLRVIVHEDKSTPMAAINLLYNVGARDESPEKTGFAHLFEHLMFGGSANVPNFDDPLQIAGGESNAFTNNDITNYYEVLPAQNLETAFWLESDRMLQLNFDSRSLDVQKKVVIEEFKETCLNIPYGDVWHHISDMAYKVHPYRWPTIGKVPAHVEEATMEEVKSFYCKYYRPNNAVLAVTGHVDVAEVHRLAEKWFADIPAGAPFQRQLPQEPPQKGLEHRINHAQVPMDAIYLAFHTGGRLHPDFYITDILSDILCNGPSSRLHQNLLKKKQLFVEIDCYITGSIDPGLLMIEGKPSRKVSLEDAKAAIWEELTKLKDGYIPENELQKWKNKVESTLVFSEMNILNKAINLAFFELLGQPDLINNEVKHYEGISVEDIYRVSNEILTLDNCCELHYKAN